MVNKLPVSGPTIVPSSKAPASRATVTAWVSRSCESSCLAGPRSWLRSFDDDDGMLKIGEINLRAEAPRLNPVLDKRDFVPSMNSSVCMNRVVRLLTSPSEAT